MTDEQKRRDAAARQRIIEDQPWDTSDLDEQPTPPMNLEQRYWDDGPDPDPTFSSTMADMEARQASGPVTIISPGRGGPIPVEDDRQDVASDQPTPGVSD